ncbi:MAG: hypothetical protein MK132_12635 [Lentisphaerales bacterium]|nr:hypothetical protein [Lentisphaerales bacterium]
MNWDLSKPQSSNFKDQDVSLKDSSLAGYNICLGICGSIAAYKGPDIIRELRSHGATVQAFVSKSALNFVTEMALEWTSSKPVVSSLSANAEHLGGDKEFDLYLFAPATYSSINKMAAGIADTPVTLAFSAALGQLEKSKAQIFISPCMHGNMHNSILQNSMQKLQELGITFLKPRQEDGKNKLPEPQEIVTTIIKELKQQLSESTSRKSPLKSTSASKQINISANPR